MVLLKLKKIAKVRQPNIAPEKTIHKVLVSKIEMWKGKCIDPVQQIEDIQSKIKENTIKVEKYLDVIVPGKLTH